MSHYLVVDFQAGERGILKADIDSSDREANAVVLVSLKWRADRQVGFRVAIQDVDEFLTFNRTNQQTKIHVSSCAHLHENIRSSLRVNCEILARNDSAASSLSVGLLVNAIELALLRQIFQDDDSSRVRAHHHVV